MCAQRRPDADSFFPEQRRAAREITSGIEDRIEKLHVQSAMKRAGEVLFFVLLYAAGALAVFFSAGRTLMTVPGILAMGFSFNALGILIHEGLHGLLAKRAWLNRLLSFLVGLPILMSASAYRETHSDHHWFLGRKPDYGTYKQHVRRPSLVWGAYFLQLLLGTFIYALSIPFLGFRVADAGNRLLIAIEYLVIAASFGFFLHAADPDTVVRYWLLPIIVMSMLTNIRGLASHALSNTENIYLSSRTVVSSRLMSRLLLNENYHLEHHLFPGVPSYNLPAMHRLIWNRLPEALYAATYREFLFGFIRAARRNDLGAMGVVFPRAAEAG